MKQQAVVLNNLPILEEVDQLKIEIDKLRPLPVETEQRILQKLRLEWNYHSNAIEGNTLSYGETVAFLMHGLTAKGKPLKDHLDIRGHNEAINFLLGMVKDSRAITETDIRGLHEMVLVEPYKVRGETPSGLPTKKTIQLGRYKEEPNHVKTATGEIHYYASPEETPAKMGDIMAWYQQAQEEAKIHPLVIAGLFHHEFVAIHPFDDGNGRMARLLMNLILMQHGLPPLVVKQNDRTNYYQILSQADAGEYEPLITYFGELMRRSLTIYQKGARGESLVEAEDVDKEIALFKKGLNKETFVELIGNDQTIRNALLLSVQPLTGLILEKAHKLDDLFIKSHDIVKARNFQGQMDNLGTEALQWWEDRISGNVQYFQFSYSWQGYKHTKQNFGVSIGFSVSFSAYNYIVEYLKYNQIEKLYHELLTPEEMNQIVKEIIGKVMAEIKQKAENQSE